MGQNSLFTVGFIFIILGIAVIFIVLLLSMLLQEKVEVSGGGIIMIGPIPIIFGSDAKTLKALLIIGIALAVIFFTFYVLSAAVW